MPTPQTRIRPSITPSSREARFSPIGGPDLEAWFPHVAPTIERALERSGFRRYAIGDVALRLVQGRMQLWLGLDDNGPRVVVITEVTPYPLGTTCGIFVCTGEGRADWLKYLGVIEEWARQLGCVSMAHIAREGWARVLEPLGYRKTHVVLEKKL